MDKIFKVERDILLYSLRYALGRQTFAPITVIDNIKHNIELFSKESLQMIIRDIKEQASLGYGMDCDKQQWLGFIEYIQERIDKYA